MVVTVDTIALLVSLAGATGSVFWWTYILRRGFRSDSREEISKLRSEILGQLGNHVYEAGTDDALLRMNRK